MSQRKLSIKHLPTKLAIINIVIFTLCLTYSFLLDYLPYFQENIIYTGFLATFWFSGLGYFTNQTNILILVFTILYLVFYKTKLFSHAQFLFQSATYISLTCLLCWTVLVPITLAYKTAHINVSMSISIVLMHLVTPVMFMIFSYFVLKQEQFKNIKLNYFKQSMYALIYPTIYAAYLIAINFIPIPESMFRDNCSPSNGYISIYGAATNFNNQCSLPIFNNSSIPTYDGPTGSLSFLFVPLLFILFAIGIACLYTYLLNRICNPHKSKVTKR